MAGGTWVSQNKIRAGAYINFKAVPQQRSGISERGVMTMPVSLDWGEENKLILVTSEQLIDGGSLAKIGVTAFDGDKAQIFREALKNCARALIYRLDTGGTAAAATSNGFTITAQCNGILGNEIKIVVAAVPNIANKFDVITVVKGMEKERQRVSALDELAANEWVTFNGTGAPVPIASIALEGGTNGTTTDANYVTYFNMAKNNISWNTMAVPSLSATLPPLVKELIEHMRDTKGRKAQAVVYDYPAANYEGIISVDQGYKTKTETIQPHTFVAYVAGLTAGASLVKSNTHHVIEGATEIINPYTDEDIEAGLTLGKFLLSKNAYDEVVVEKDINTLYNYPADKDYSFSKNRVIRTLDDIDTFIQKRWQRSYIGKVDNDDQGRNMLKTEIIKYMQELQGGRAIQNFDPQSDIEVLQGMDIDAVVTNFAAKPVDAMEKLYVTVNVTR